MRLRAIGKSVIYNAWLCRTLYHPDRMHAGSGRASVQLSIGVIRVLSVALLAVTGCANVSLQQYYARVDPTAQIDIDPIGGYMLLYWVDSRGTACHGAPGLSGQPGPAAITVARPAAIQDAIGGASITAPQLAAYQIIPYTVSDYTNSGAAGYHFFQFDNLLWRLRGNGQALRDAADHHYSVPQVIDVDHRPRTLSPVYAWRRPDCDLSQFLVAGDGVLEEPGQHPTQCRTKAFPPSGTMAEDLLLSYCVKRLPQGTRYHTY
jgi:hypothetical protein